MTEDEKEYALKAAEATALMMPYLQKGELVPGFVQLDIRNLYVNTTEEELVVGAMRACDVAIKHVSNHFLGGSLPEAASETVSILKHLQSRDLAGFGSQAYDDGARAVRLMADAMVRHGRVAWAQELETSKRILLAFDIVLIALLFRLAAGYGREPSWAALQLCKEITTVTPRAF